MNAKIQIIFVGLMLFFGAQEVLCQLPTPRPEGNRDTRLVRPISDFEWNQQVQKMARGDNSNPGLSRVVITNAPTNAPKLSNEAAKRLKIDKNDLAAYKDFLKKPNTGIFKLLNSPTCVGKTGEEWQKCFQEARGIAYFANAYSFRAKEYKGTTHSDLTMQKGNLFTVPFGVFSFMVSLGDVPLDDLTLSSAGIKYLAEYKIPETVAEADAQIKPFINAVTIDDYIYFRGFVPIENRTFAMRSAGYKNDENPFLGKPDDVVVVFRIIRLEANESITILWKELRRQKGIKIKT